MAADVALYLAIVYHFCPAIVFIAVRPVKLGRIVMDGVEVALAALGKSIDN